MLPDEPTPRRSELRMEVGDKAFVDWTSGRVQRSLTTGGAVLGDDDGDYLLLSVDGPSRWRLPR